MIPTCSNACLRVYRNSRDTIDAGRTQQLTVQARVRLTCAGALGQLYCSFYQLSGSLSVQFVEDGRVCGALEREDDWCLGGRVDGWREVLPLDTATVFG
jgi:hypothetical protein